MKAYLSILLCGIVAHAIAAPVSKEFDDLGIVETPYHLWRPLGPTTAGLNVEVELVGVDGNQVASMYLWRPKGSSGPSAIHSLASANSALRDLARSGREAARLVVDARALLSCSVAPHGRTGFYIAVQKVLYLDGLVERLRKAGMSKNSEALIRHCADESVDKIDQNRVSWRSIWFEVTTDGSIERVELEGTVDPFQIESMSRSVLRPAGTIDPKVLWSDNVMDYTIQHGPRYWRSPEWKPKVL